MSMEPETDNMKPNPSKPEFSLDLDLERKEEKIKLGGKPFVLREMDGTQLSFYQGMVSKRVKYSKKGEITEQPDMKGLDTALISFCLFDEKGQAVPTSVIDQWPSSVKIKLSDRCRKMNGLDEEEAAEIKKD